MALPAFASRSVALACGLALAALAAGCGGPEGLRVEGNALSPSRHTGPVYVADSLGQPLRRPTAIRLSESVSVSGLHWQGWGGTTARAVGKLGGDWCRPGCRHTPYDVNVVLSGLEQQERVAYYRRATVDPVRPAELPDSAASVQLQGIRLAVPEL
ncbi:hypothetical protein G3I40_41490 [Streptomyces sp. SID14478]|uniref:hypothetical protein n=1 Tax=Streptomyces sp. SID14478 TaxID=2706073 RepID=UPI0013E0190C|nr:hypothetical protein [Streptomyces sp. SID14478]NEB81642.1 hypothetical protein [Streptomyces sp. SID14478]